MNRLIVALVLFIFVSCGTQRQLRKTFVNKPITEIIEKFGEPKTILEQTDSKVYVFEKLKKLRSTEVSQGKLTLDPIITPKVDKTERYYFTVKEGKVVKTKLEEEYVKN